jgi:uncharacterized membrane protein
MQGRERLDNNRNCCDNDFMPVRTERTLLTVIAFLAALWCAGVFGAPLLRHAGIGASEDLYAFYGRVCHQLDGRSWHVNGEPLAVCVRCSAIYSSFLVSVLAMLAFRPRWSRVPSMIPLAVALSLMALDAALNIIGVAASTEVHRVITGSFVGLLLPWYLVPLLVEAIAGVRRTPRSNASQGEPVHVRETE